MSMPLTPLFFPSGKDATVTATFPEISDGTGMTSTYWWKSSREVLDTDPSALSYQSSVTGDPSNVAQTLAQFQIPGADVANAGVYWWRVDVTDTVGHTQTAADGPMLIQAV